MFKHGMLYCSYVQKKWGKSLWNNLSLNTTKQKKMTEWHLCASKTLANGCIFITEEGCD